MKACISFKDEFLEELRKRKLVCRPVVHGCSCHKGLDPSIKPTTEYLDRIRMKRPENLEIPIRNYINKSLIEFLLSTNQRLWIQHYEYLDDLLESLREMNLYQNSIITKVVGFRRHFFEPLLWGSKIYNKFIDEIKKDRQESRELM